MTFTHKARFARSNRRWLWLALMLLLPAWLDSSTALAQVAPVLAPIGAQSVDEGATLSFAATATDGDATIPIMTAENLPINASFVDNLDGTGTFTFNPDFTQSGVFNVTFIASDGTLADSEIVAITVNNVNRAPVLAAIGPQSVNENATLNFGTSATDPDLQALTMTAVNVPLNANYVDNGNGTGTFTFNPDFTQSGVFNVTFIASDGTLADSEIVAITVNNVNRPPVLAAIGPQSVNENATLNFGTSATDPDLQALTMTAVNVPLNANYVDNGNGTGTLTFNPDFTQSGVFNVTFIASDGTLADSEIVAITVNNVNRAPVLAAIGPQSVNENATLNFGASATDPDLQALTMTAVNVPLNANYVDNGNGTGTFTFNPDFTQSGVFNVTFIASDGTLADSEIVAITVNNVNRPPVLAAIGPQSVNENATLNFGTSATDPDLQALTMTAVNVPLNATYIDNGNGTGSFTFNPDFTQSGVFNVTFIASDGTLADSEIVAITVNNVNRPPVLAAIGPQSVNENATLNFGTSATDPDLQALTMTAVNVPLNATYIDNGNGTGTFTFNPDFTQSGVFNVTFIASDGTLADSEIVAITVNNVNRAPVLAAIGPQSVNENATLNFGASATDPDLQALTMTAVNVPLNANYVDNGNGTGTFTFNPDFTQSGVFNVTFIASDGTLADSEIVAITVNNVNRPPVLAAIGPQSVNENATLNFGTSATDPDLQTLTMTAVNVPLNANYVDNGNGTGTFTFSPDFTQSGVFNVTFIASDGTLADSEIVAITVNNVNRAPVLAAIGPQSVNENATLNFGTSATDPDLQALTMTAVNVPLNATYIDNGNGTGTFTFNPDFTQSGVFNVTFIASDGTLADSEIVTITVNNVNRAPVLAAIGPQSVNENATLNFGTSATDPDLQALTMTAVNVPLNATYIDNGNGTGTFTFNPDFTQSGVFNVTFIASDGTLADSEVVVITVNNVNRAPVLAAIGPQSVNENATLNFGTSATDPDLQALTMTAVNVPLNATYIDNGNGTGSFTFNPDFTQSGVFNVTFIASDGTLADSEIVAITVNNVNLPPVLAAIGPQSVNENATLNFGASATDPDLQALTMTAVNVPLNANYVDNGNGTGTFTFNPDFTQSGVFNVTFIASDGTLADSEVVAITVNNVNRPPVLAAIGPQSVNENATLNFGASATDPDLQALTMTALNVPLNATYIDNGNGTGTFTFNPDFTQSGVFNVTFIASDGTLADSEVVAITVNNVNRAPVLAAIGPQSVNENATLNFGTSATDPDLQALTMTALNVPLNATYIDNGNGTGTFTFNPDFTQSGVFNVTFIASDGTLADSEVVAITVNNVNRPPVLAAIGPQSVNENATLNFGASATDPDLQALTMTAVNVPLNATYIDNGNGTGTFTFNPDFTQSGVFNVTFITSDGTLADSEIVAITVNNVNLPPVLATIGPRSVTEGQILNFNISATDPDLTIPTLIAQNLPTNATFVDNGNGTGTFNFAPNFVQAGTYNVRFITSDGALADTELVVITVNEAGNQRPVLATIGPRSVTEGQNLTFNIAATDPDQTTPTFSAVNVPANATFTNNGNGTATFVFNPNFVQAANYVVTFIATDGVLADSEIVTITVNEAGNQRPVLATIGNKTIGEGSLLTFGLSATDPDQTFPAFLAFGMPANATLSDNGNGTATFNFSPNFNQAAIYSVTFVAFDGQLADSEIVQITVTNTNRAPVLAVIGPRSVAEGGTLNFGTSASDPDAQPLAMTATNVPLNANYIDNGNGTGSFSFSPNFTQAGVYNVTFIASDGNLADSETVAITVTGTNLPPVLAAIGAKSITEGQLLSFGTSATDPDLSTPTLIAVGLPTGATYIDNTNGTGTFTWTPTFIQAGIYNVTFIASDGLLADSEVVAITVNEAGNQRPVLAAIGARSVTEGVNLNFNATATDPDATTPTLSAVGLPTGAAFVDNANGSGTFNWTPTFIQAGVYNVTFIASDGVLADSEVVAITVNEAGNQRPVLAAIGPRSVAEGATLNFNATATDADATTPTLSAVGLPSGATFVDNANGSGTFNWIPTFTQSGVYNVTFIASDGTLADSEVVAITVTDAGNQRPVLVAIGPQSVTEGQLLTFGTSATDPDNTTPTMTASGLPSGATYVDNGNGTGTFTWTPTFIQAGIYNVTFIASDGTLADSEVVAITVNEAGNQRPVLAAIGARSVTEGVNLNFNATAADPDATTPTLSAVGLPTGAAFVDNANGSGTFNWTPSFIQAGVYNVTFIASDGVLADSEVVAITVNEAGNQRPVLAAIGPRSVAEGATLNFNATATDADATTPTLSAVGLPSGATFVDNANGSGTFNWIPTFTQSGVYNVTVIASDGTLADSESVAITVTEAGNQAPILAAIGPRSVTENQLLAFGTSATDPDLTIPALTAVNLPSGATYTDNGNATGTFTWTPTFIQAGIYNVTFIASDGVLADSEVVAITVNDAGNQRPVLLAISPKTVDEGANLSFGALAADPDQTTPALTATNMPVGASFIDGGNGTGAFNWTPDFAQSGVYNVNIIASDGLLADTEVVQITVNNVNLAPVLAAIGPKSVPEGVNLNFNVTATDPDLTTPTLTASGVPLNATFIDNGNGSGTFNFTPDFTQSGVYNVTFVASDGVLADTEVVQITVTEFNRPPVLAAIGPKNVAEGATLNFGTSATDPDGAIPALTATGLPLGATYVDNGNGTATFDFTPSYTQSGVYNVTFVASDGSLADTEVVAITVTNTNLPPVLAGIGPRNVNEGAILNFNATATDPDLTTPTLTATGLPLNATFVDNGNGSGTFNFAPTYTQSGVYNVLFVASDGFLADSELVAITVVDQGGNVPPARITTLMANIVGDAIRLTWTPVTTDSLGTPTLVDRYVIYRGTRAYFTPSPAESIGTVGALVGQFDDNNIGGANVVGDTAINYFYAVIVVDQIARRSNVSNRVGEYDYQIITTATTDFNLVGLPFTNTGLATAQDVINSMGGTTTVNTLNNFIPSSQSYQARFAAGFGTNFTVQPGSVFQVNAKVNFVWSIAGRVPAAGSVTYPIATTPTTDYALLMMPFEYDGVWLVAQDLINNIPTLLNTLNEFLPSSQSYRSRFAAGFGTNFTVRAGRVYQANAKANGTFPQ